MEEAKIYLEMILILISILEMIERNERSNDQ